jgi:hypothetical protein
MKNPWSEALNGSEARGSLRSGVRPMRPKMLDRALGGGAWWRDMSEQEAIKMLESSGYVVVTEAQWDHVVDALGPASDDVLELIFDDE